MSAMSDSRLSVKSTSKALQDGAASSKAANYCEAEDFVVDGTNQKNQQQHQEQSMPSEMKDWSNDTEPPRQWNLPSGAAHIIEQIAAEELLGQLLQPLPSSHTKKLQNEQQQEKGGNASSSSSSSSLYARADLAAIETLVTRCPAICARTYELPWEDGGVRQLFPLAKLVLLQPTVTLLERVYQAYPPAVTQAEPTKGCIPLHYACSSEGTLEMVRFLHQQSPSSIRQPRKDGMWPLHLACYFNAPLNIVEYVLRQAPEAMDVKDQEDWTPLHAAARGHATLRVIKYLYTTAHATREILLPTDDHGRTPLHLACMKQGDKQNVEYLFFQEPQAMDMEDAHSLTPLFHAAKSQNAETLWHLLRVMHQQQQFEDDDYDNLPPPLPTPPRDQFGSTLLHFAVAANSDADVVDFLCLQYPDMVYQRSADAMSYSALHVACLCNGPVENIRRLVHHFPECLFFITGQGQFAWEIAQRCPRVQPELVEFLLSAKDDPEISERYGWHP